MNAPASMLEAQTLALLRRLAREQDARCHRIGDEAARQAAEIVRKARLEARARERQSVADARRELERALAQRRAALDTGVRQRQQALLGDWLEHAWQALPAALHRRWEEPSSRAQWCAAAMRAAARDLLGNDALQVAVDPRWLAAVTPLVTRACPADRAATVVPQPGLGAGLRIRAGHASVDATIPGLLAPRDRIAAELLAEVRARTMPPSTENAP